MAANKQTERDLSIILHRRSKEVATRYQRIVLRGVPPSVADDGLYEGLVSSGSTVEVEFDGDVYLQRRNLRIDPIWLYTHECVDQVLDETRIDESTQTITDIEASFPSFGGERRQKYYFVTDQGKRGSFSDRHLFVSSTPYLRATENGFALVEGILTPEGETIGIVRKDAIVSEDSPTPSYPGLDSRDSRDLINQIRSSLRDMFPEITMEYEKQMRSPLSFFARARGSLDFEGSRRLPDIGLISLPRPRPTFGNFPAPDGELDGHHIGLPHRDTGRADVRELGADIRVEELRPGFVPNLEPICIPLPLLNQNIGPAPIPEPITRVPIPNANLESETDTIIPLFREIDPHPCPLLPTINFGEMSSDNSETPTGLDCSPIGVGMPRNAQMATMREFIPDINIPFLDEPIQERGLPPLSMNEDFWSGEDLAWVLHSFMPRVNTDASNEPTSLSERVLGLDYASLYPFSLVGAAGRADENQFRRIQREGTRSWLQVELPPPHQATGRAPRSLALLETVAATTASAPKKLTRGQKKERARALQSSRPKQIVPRRQNMGPRR
jgi:hypothetical protein